MQWYVWSIIPTLTSLNTWVGGRWKVWSYRAPQQLSDNPRVTRSGYLNNELMMGDTSDKCHDTPRHTWLNTRSRLTHIHIRLNSCNLGSFSNNYISMVCWVQDCGNASALAIDKSHKSQNAPVPYTAMHHFVTEMCTCVHIFVTRWCIVGYLSDALWDLWDGSYYTFF